MKNCLKEDCTNCKDPDLSSCDSFQLVLSIMQKNGYFSDTTVSEKALDTIIKEASNVLNPFNMKVFKQMLQEIYPLDGESGKD